MDSFIKKIKSFVNNILIKTKRFKKPIAFTLSACFILVAVILCSFFVRNNAKDNNEEKEVLMGTEQTVPSSEPISESTTEPTEPETEPTEASTEPPTEAPTEPVTEPTETPMEPEIEYSVYKRDFALEGSAVDFRLAWSGSHGCSLGDNIIATYRFPYDTNADGCLFIERLAVITSLEDLKLIINEYRPYTGVDDPRLSEWLKGHDKSFFVDNSIIVMTNTGRDTILDDSLFLTKNGAELSIGFGVLVENPYGFRPDVITYCSKIIEISKADLDGVDTISCFAVQAE